MKEKIIKDFQSSKNNLDSFRQRMENLLLDLLSHGNITIHQISCRTKDLESLSKKIDQKQGKYQQLSDITDLVGIRIITYLESDVDTVSNLIETEFKIDEKNSIDKRILKTDQFGYKSLHKVISINDKRTALTEYKSYKNLKCEIQIRSILQHAWAEIEHDLGYKSTSAIPNSSVRSFNRLAALLETADIEFDRLKKELSNYEKEVPKLIEENPETVEIDQASLISFSNTNNILLEVQSKISNTIGAQFIQSTDYQGILARFPLFNLNTIKELEDSLRKNHSHFVKFCISFISESKYDKLPNTLPLFYYQHFLAAETGDVQFVLDYFDISPQITGSIAIAKRFIETYQSSK